MESDNVANAAIETRQIETNRRSSRSRSMTPLIVNSVIMESAKVISNSGVSSENLPSVVRRPGRPATSSSKSVSKSKTVIGKNDLTVISESNSIQREARLLKNIPVDSESVTLSGADYDVMELRSDRLKIGRHNNSTVVNGTGKDDATVVTSNTSTLTSATNRRTGNRSRTTVMKTSDYSSDDEQDENERGAQSQRVLDVYKGEFWNKLPKTDFTYSPVSPHHYKEVAPGVSIKPNMSRSSYQSASEGGAFYSAHTVHSPTRTTKVTTTTKKTSSTTSTSNLRQTRFYNAARSGSRVPAYIQTDYASTDSDSDEVDMRVRAAAAASAAEQKTSVVTYFTSFFTTVWTLITTTCTTVVEITQHVLGLRNDGAINGYSTPIRRQASSGWWQKVTNVIYFLPALITTGDLVVLSSTGEATGRRRWLKYFAGLMLLLLLLLCGLLYLRNNTTETAVMPVLHETYNVLGRTLREWFGSLGGWFRSLGGWFRSLGGWFLFPFVANRVQREGIVTSIPVKESQATGNPPLSVLQPLGSTPPTFEKVEISVFIDHLLESEQFAYFMASREAKFTKDDLIREILASDQLTNWIALKLKESEVNVETMTLQILSSSRFERAVVANQKSVDLAALTAEIWGGGHFQLLFDAYLDEKKRKLPAEIWGEGQLQRLFEAYLDERKEKLPSEIWGTGQLQQFFDARLEKEKHKLVVAQLEDNERAKEGGAINVELLRASLQQELDEKNKYFEEHNAKLAGEIERLKEEVERKLNARLDDLKNTQEEEIRMLKAQLTKCCDKPLPAFPEADIEKHVLRYIASVYGMSNAEKVNYADIQALMGNMFVGKKQFEAALANVTAQHNVEMREVSEQSAQAIMDTISERISEEFASHHKIQMAAGGTLGYQQSDIKSTFVDNGSGLTDNQVWAIVNQAIMTYDADKTGMVDYALESAGGSVISTRCTETYYKHSASLTLFGIPYWYTTNTPRTVIQPGVHPGECWAFRGSQGFLVIQLAGKVRISSFSLEHIPRSLAFSGNIGSAPKDFTVWGLETEGDPEPTELGKYMYMKNGTSLQYFIVKRSDIPPFELIELRIDSNHGNLEYTCLYRFRVHGTWVPY